MPLIPVNCAWIDALPRVGGDRDADIRAMSLLADKLNTAFNEGAFDTVDAWLSYVPQLDFSRLILVGFLRFSVCAVHRGHLPCFPLAVWRVWLRLEKMTLGPGITVQQVLRGLVKPGSTRKEDVMSAPTTEQRNAARLADAYVAAAVNMHNRNQSNPPPSMTRLSSTSHLAMGSRVVVDLQPRQRFVLSTHPPTRRVTLEAEWFMGGIDAGTGKVSGVWETVADAHYHVECFSLAGEWCHELEALMVTVVESLLDKLAQKLLKGVDFLPYVSPHKAEIKQNIPDAASFV